MLNNPMAKKVLLVEGSDERDLCSLLIDKKLNLFFLLFLLITLCIKYIIKTIK